MRLLIVASLLASFNCHAQLRWIRVDSLFGKLPSSIHVYKTIDSLDGKPNVAYYVEANLKDRRLRFSADTTLDRRLTPSQFYQKNGSPFVVVNTTFFSFATNRNLNTVIKEGKLVSYNVHSIAGRGKDTFTYRHPLASAIGISKKRRADVAWVYTDSSLKKPVAFQVASAAPKDSLAEASYDIYPATNSASWTMQTAVGGGPVLLQNGMIQITNNEEIRFAGKAINDKHPRTAMGYTDDNRLLILVVEGRNPGIAEGATLEQEARILKELGCREALNLDGGGSSCLLVNGMKTIYPSDKGTERPVPAVFIIANK